MERFLNFHVTGAAGFVGRHVCKVLASAGHSVRAVIRNTDEELSQLGVELFIGDLWDQELLARATADADVVIHCAGNARYGNGPNYQKENVLLTEQIIFSTKKSAREARFVLVSTIGCIDRAAMDACSSPLNEESPPFPTSDYGKSKLNAEELVKRSGLTYSIVRPSMVVARDMRADSHFAVFARKALDTSFFAHFDWPGQFSVIHVKDLAEAIVMVSTEEAAVGETYFCAGDAISLGEFLARANAKSIRLPLRHISKFVGKFPRYVPFPLKVMLFSALTASDVKLRGIGWKPRHGSESALGEVIHREKCRLNPEMCPGGQTVITGAASGLGRALAERLSPLRETLLLIDKNKLALEELACKIGNCKFIVADLAQAADLDAILASRQWRETRVTELYACAGVGFRGRMQEISVRDHQTMFAVNVLARIALGRAAIGPMRRRGFGRVILISSSSAFQALPYMATYAGSNSALLSIGEAWGHEVSADGVRVMTVCPGGMQTNFQRSSGVAEIAGEKLMLPEEVADAIIAHLHWNRGVLIVSFRSFAMAMLARILPRAWSVKLWGRLMAEMR